MAAHKGNTHITNHQIIKKSNVILLLFILIIVAVSQGCSIINPPEPTNTIMPTSIPNSATPDQASTIYAYQTQLSGVTLTAQFTPLPLPTATATVTPIPPTKVPTPTITATRQDCYWTEFVRDISIPDGTELDPGASFTKTWRLRNAGSCAWTTDYDIVFVRGESFKAPTRIGMPRTVNPGEMVDISLLMEAPTYPGKYTGYFMLADDDGRRFGTGIDADGEIWVEIIVRLQDEIKYNFTENYCKALWRSSMDDTLPCPGDETEPDLGYVVYQSNPLREDGVLENEPGLITSPDRSNYGFIYGVFPSIMIEKGDIFRSLIGCVYDSPDCELTFELRYQIENDVMRTIKSWDEIYDGQYHFATADLSELAGYTVKLILYVENNGSTINNRGLWIFPRIMR